MWSLEDGYCWILNAWAFNGHMQRSSHNNCLTSSSYGHTVRRWMDVLKITCLVSDYHCIEVHTCADRDCQWEVMVINQTAICVIYCTWNLPIMLLELPIMLLSIIPKTSLLCSKLCFWFSKTSRYLRWQDTRKAYVIKLNGLRNWFYHTHARHMLQYLHACLCRIHQLSFVIHEEHAGYTLIWMQ